LAKQADPCEVEYQIKQPQTVEDTPNLEYRKNIFFKKNERAGETDAA
jgi:hypothetical protein